MVRRLVEVLGGQIVLEHEDLQKKSVMGWITTAIYILMRLTPKSANSVDLLRVLIMV